MLLPFCVNYLFILYFFISFARRNNKRIANSKQTSKMPGLEPETAQLITAGCLFAFQSGIMEYTMCYFVFHQ